jgi:hypothetical protein
MKTMHESGQTPFFVRIVLIPLRAQLRLAPIGRARGRKKHDRCPVSDAARVASEERLQTSSDDETLADIAWGADPVSEGGESSDDGAPGAEGDPGRRRDGGGRVVASNVT